MSASLFTSNLYTLTNRESMPYEIISVKIDNQNITISGWALIRHTQHFKNSSTHDFFIELKSNNETISKKAKLVNHNLTRIMQYSGYRTCNSKEYNKTTCNYQYENVGFEFKIPLNELKLNQEYKAYLLTHAKQTGHRYKIPLYYISDGNVVHAHDFKKYTILSDFKYQKFRISAKTLFAKLGPTPASATATTNLHCSNAHGNRGFMKYNAKFENIQDMAKYDRLITYFKVNVQEDRCYDSRARLIESKSNRMQVWVPNNYVDYYGNPMIIYVTEDKTTPDLITEDADLYQYAQYDPFDYANAFDKKDGDLSNKIRVTSSNVNTRVPGNYKTCYSVTNSFGVTSTGCSNVLIRKLPVKHRFISKYTIHDTDLSLWDRKLLKSKLNEFKPIKEEYIKP